MIRVKNKTEGLLLLITKNCEQTHTRAQETLEFKPTKSRETFHFNPPIQNKGDWMIRLISLEDYNSISNLTEENNKFELYTDNFESDFSFNELRQGSRRAWSFRY